MHNAMNPSIEESDRGATEMKFGGLNLLFLKLHYGARHRLALILKLRQQIGFVFKRRFAFLQKLRNANDFTFFIMSILHFHLID